MLLLLVPSPLAVDQPFSEKWGSIAEEPINIFSHAGENFRSDKETVFTQLVTTTLSTSYLSTIATFKHGKCGHNALEALKVQFAGAAYRDKEVQIQDSILRYAT